MSSAAHRLAARAWEIWLADPRPLDRIFGRIVRDGRAPAAESAEGWQRVSAAARLAGWLAARRDPGAWFASLDPLAEIRKIPAFWASIDRLLMEPVPADRAAWRAGTPAEQVAAAGVAPGWTAALVDRFGVDLPRFLAALDRPPPLWIRARRVEEIPALIAALRAEGFQVRPRDGLALAVRGDRPIHFTAPFREGAFEVQDLASQHVVDRLPPGAPVWDACAGEGGKTLGLAARLGGRSAVWASDVRDDRLASLRRRVRRAGWQNVRSFPWDGSAKPPLPREAAAGFPLVLVDLPCSACGTWRRNPEVRLSPVASPELLALQERLLRHASEAVRPGGAIGLATCSFDRRENETQLARIGWTVEQAGCHGSPDDDADTLFLGVARR